MLPSASELPRAEHELVALYRQLARDSPMSGGKWDHPFLAGRGRAYGQGQPRILIVGKATGGWSDVPDTSNAASIRRWSDTFIDDIKSAPFSAFWRYVEQLAGSIARRTGQEWKLPLEHIAWTNLARIGFAGGNPSGQEFEVQRDVCRRLLLAELEWLKPDLILLLTHTYQAGFVKSLFEGITWADLPSCGHKDAWVGRWRSDALVVWTAHPERKALSRLGAERAAIVEAFCGSIGRPPGNGSVAVR
jgi:hypothetical protein